MPQLARLLKPHFHVKKKRLKRWPKRKTKHPKRNLVLSLLTGDAATIRGLCERTGLDKRVVLQSVNGQHPLMSAQIAQRIAHGLGVSTDLFLDVLRVYTGWPDNRKVKSKGLAKEKESLSGGSLNVES